LYDFAVRFLPATNILNDKKGISFLLAVRIHKILKIDVEELLNVKIISSPQVRKTTVSQDQKAGSGQVKLSYG
jgi:plasmid maintenance system antidote protein VapI